MATGRCGGGSSRGGRRRRGLPSRARAGGRIGVSLMSPWPAASGLGNSTATTPAVDPSAPPARAGAEADNRGRHHRRAPRGASSCLRAPRRRMRMVGSWSVHRRRPTSRPGRQRRRRLRARPGGGGAHRRTTSCISAALAEALALVEGQRPVDQRRPGPGRPSGRTPAKRRAPAWCRRRPAARSGWRASCTTRPVSIRNSVAPTAHRSVRRVDLLGLPQRLLGRHVPGRAVQPVVGVRARSLDWPRTARPPRSRAA